jgi:tetratricopeptide (TPR) repeat protein
VKPGTRLGPYEIVALIGSGGMGEVYRARDTRLGRDVAIKVLTGEFAADPERLRRFEQEARAVAALDHPNILAIHDVGTHEGSPYIVTQLLEGESLRERLQAGSLTPRKAIEVGAEIAQGLAAAHEKGIVHRDLKPANVFITKDGLVKILDFGIAKLVTPRRAVEPAKATTVVEATEAGTTLGTVGYMSPEQVRGQSVDHRTDIFSFGCVLYEMLSGRSPVRRDTAAETMTAILHDDPAPLAGTVRTIPPAIEGIVTRCLEKQQADRFSSAHDLALALRAYSGGSETPATAKASARVLRVRRSWLVGAVGVGLLAVTAAALFVRAPWKRAAPAPAFDPSSVVVAVFENRTGDASLVSVGEQISDALTTDLLKTGELKVAVSPVASGRRGEAGGDPLLRLAQATRSALVVAGTYDLRGDELEVQARVVDPWQGKVVYTAVPVRCPRADTLPALEPLRQRVTGAVAWTLDRRLRIFFSGFRPPRYDALLEFREGRAEFLRDMASALAHYERAAALDPEFDLARVYHLNTLMGEGRPEEAAKELAGVEANLGRMVPVERVMVRHYRAWIDGRLLDALAALREWMTLSEFPAAFQLDIGDFEMSVNRPAEAIRTISGVPADWEALEYSIVYRRELYLTVAYHMNRDYAGQLRVGRESQRRFPGVLEFYSAEAGALAALGRLDEIEKVVESCQAAQVGVRTGTPGDVILEAASELRAHGHRETSLRVAERAVAWYRARPAAEAAKYQGDLLGALRQSEQWAEAKARADAELAKNPDEIDLCGLAGMLAAHLGDAVQARRMEAKLAALTRPYLYGRHTYQRACIAAHLGEKDRALGLLRDAFAQGYWFDLHIHRDLGLEPLWGYPPYEELMKPKG